MGVVLFVAGQMVEGPRFLFIGVPVALIFAGSFSLKLPRMPVAHFLGDASYSIYLFHLIALKAAWDWLGVPMGSLGLATAAAGIALGCAFYWFVERPILDRTNAHHIANRMGPRPAAVRTEPVKQPAD